MVRKSKNYTGGWNKPKGISKKEKLEKKIVDHIMSALEVYIKGIKDDFDD